jgi:hypothetical protein
MAAATVGLAQIAQQEPKGVAVGCDGGVAHLALRRQVFAKKRCTQGAKSGVVMVKWFRMAEGFGQ